MPNDLAGFFREHPTIRLVALNGGTDGRLYHKLAEVPGLAAMGFEEKVRAWRIITGCLKT